MRQFTLAFLLVVMALATGLDVAAQQFRVNGNKAVLDTANNVWLCSVPRDGFGTDFATTVEYDSTIVSLSINEVVVASGDSIILADLQGGKDYEVSLVTTDGVAMSGQLTFTWLPIIEVTGTIGDEYSRGTVTVNMPDGSKGNQWLAKLKTGGNYTNHDDKHKRNYHIKFIDENGEKKNRRLLGLRKDNHWRLDAGQMDLLRVRNRVGADLWLDVTREPWYVEAAPDAVNGSHGGMTELFLNGEYRGIYNLHEPMDRKQLQLVKYDTIGNEFHGQLWFSKKWCRTATMYQPVECSNDQENWDYIYVRYPDFDEVHPTDWTVLYNTVWFVNRMDATDNDTMLADSLGVYFDLPLLIDYYVFIVTLQALDNSGKNMFYGCYDRTIDKRLTVTAWDLDMSVGADLSITGDWTNQKRPDRPVAEWMNYLPLAHMPYMLDHFKAATKRYWELRETVFAPDSLIARYQAVIDELHACGAAAREEARWSGDSDIGGKTLDLSEEMAYVAEWIRQRIQYLDENFFIKPEVVKGDVNGDGEVTIADVNAVIDLILAGGYDAVADVNGDGEVTIADVNAVIDIILTAD